MARGVIGHVVDQGGLATVLWAMAKHSGRAEVVEQVRPYNSISAEQLVNMRKLEMGSEFFFFCFRVVGH